ncbi:hypothetical protein NLJ89_g7 [Agrocybe chaxingu]|uniref:F-box domain-containing protein n=1 Tax=Agrocybe chaxingu TaxID=84603 RepID=A0A9W8TFH8_9AGAR|nr:hypothetical protein NLJ89_g7 [Agrocybe chaxingu]
MDATIPEVSANSLPQSATAYHFFQTDSTQIHSFPVELLGHIFGLYINIELQGKGEFHDYAIFITTHDSPLILMQVCRVWRAIALATPTLWTHICPSLDSIPNIRRWLAISPKYPLYLQFTRSFHDDDVPRDYDRSVFRLFAKEAYRWRSLSIDLDSDVAQEFVKLLQTESTAPLLLEDLKVDLQSEDHRQASGSTLKFVIALLPRLKLLRRLLWIDKRGVTPLHGVPWSQLMTVIVTLPSSLEEIFLYLSQCTAATKVEFQGETLNHPEKTRLPASRFQHITLGALTTLTLSRGCDPMWLLRHFTMPSLRFLDISILRRNLAVLEDFVKRTPHLHTLIIDERRAQRRNSFIYADEVFISEQEIGEYLTSACLRSIPRVALDLLYTKSRTIALIQEGFQHGRPLPDLLCWNPRTIRMKRLVGWWHKLDERRNIVLFSYKDGTIEFTKDYYSDTSFPL